MLVTANENPFEFGFSANNQPFIVIGVNIGTGTVVLEQLINNAWVNTGDSITQSGSYRLNTGNGQSRYRIVLTGNAVVDV